MTTSIFKVGQTVTLVDTGERVEIRDVRPIGLKVIYHVEREDGQVVWVLDRQVRP